MPALDSISADKLIRLIGTPKCPAIIDVRLQEDFDADPQFVPGALRRTPNHLEDLAARFCGRSVVTVCKRGGHVSHGVAAMLRASGVAAEALEGGVYGWAGAGFPLIPAGALAPTDDHGRTVWVTRSRPKVDRIACPWLIRRFVDPHARFLFAPAPEVLKIADRFSAAPFDIEGEGVRWSHRGEACTFEVMLDGFGLSEFEPLKKLAAIVCGADTARPDLAPEAAGLVAISLGLSRMYGDDLEQLEAGMLVYDALFRWARDASEETHTWVSHQPPKPKSR